MTSHDLKRLNLNLLVALDALLIERNVTRAAHKIGIGQSAMSTCLAQLRQHFGDELLTRAGGGMRLTPRAIALEEPLRDILRQIRTLMARGSEFDAAREERMFRIAIMDGIEMLFVPALLAHCRMHAPNVQIDVSTFDPDRYTSDLDSDRLDIAIGFRMADYTHHKLRPLFRNDYVALFNSALIDVSTPITLNDYLRIPHIVMRYRGTPGSAVDDALAALGKQRKVVARMSRFLLVPELVLTAPVFATMGSRLADLCAARSGLATSPLPVKVPSFGTNMVWHASYDTDPGHRWLRQALLKIAAAL